MPKLTDFAALEQECGFDSRFAEVRLGPRKNPKTGDETWFKFQIQRLEVGAALIQGVPALISSFPSGSNDGKGGRARPMSGAQAQQLTHHFHGLICASVCGDWNDETETWDKITIDPVRHDPANGIIALNWFLPGELMELVSAIITLQTGKEVGKMLDALFQVAEAMFKTVIDGAGIPHGSVYDLDDVGTGEDSGQRSGITDGVESGTEESA